ncbi:hypothetical protein PoB_003715400 [Plakobranchus ocellatus]|uniref:Uncharacterized protein n=1 Tax=Plakobranchus ocellatus TaxID=259542 RepID=A0AAV4AX04_9GAST|nr:hypothetical protein PoB_003715400 [Plakobranchus ocellatus]
MRIAKDNLKASHHSNQAIVRVATSQRARKWTEPPNDIYYQRKNFFKTAVKRRDEIEAPQDASTRLPIKITSRDSRTLACLLFALSLSQEHLAAQLLVYTHGTGVYSHQPREWNTTLVYNTENKGEKREGYRRKRYKKEAEKKSVYR